MKNIFLILLGALLAISHAHAQLLPRPNTAQLFTNETVIYIPGITTTNFPVTMAQVVPLGRLGTGFYFGVGATNAASTTNATVWVEYVNIDTLSGATNVIEGLTNNIFVPLNGVTRNDVYTNIVTTTANLGNHYGARIRSLQNTNELGIFITNAFVQILQ